MQQHAAEKAEDDESKKALDVTEADLIPPSDDDEADEEQEGKENKVPFVKSKHGNGKRKSLNGQIDGNQRGRSGEGDFAKQILDEFRGERIEYEKVEASMQAYCCDNRIGVQHLAARVYSMTEQRQQFNRLVDQLEELGMEVIFSIYCSRGEEFGPAFVKKELKELGLALPECHKIYHKLQEMRRDAKTGVLSLPASLDESFSSVHSNISRRSYASSVSLPVEGLVDDELDTNDNWADEELAGQRTDQDGQDVEMFVDLTDADADESLDLTAYALQCKAEARIRAQRKARARLQAEAEAEAEVEAQWFAQYSNAPKTAPGPAPASITGAERATVTGIEVEAPKAAPGPAPAAPAAITGAERATVTGAE
ncbi:hypothetical protein B484DRAFT_471610, partial [Ochromonadaceae sp. CCMP2298]